MREKLGFRRSGCFIIILARKSRFKRWGAEGGTDLASAAISPSCRCHGGSLKHAISAGWIAAAVLARRQVLVTFDWDFLPLFPPRQPLRQLLRRSLVGPSLQRPGGARMEPGE
jgi:hypothetical protein